MTPAISIHNLSNTYTLHEREADGLINLVIQPSMQKFMEDVRQGTLDFM